MVVIENRAVHGIETEEGSIDADHVIGATTASVARPLIPDLPDGIMNPLETVRYNATVHVTQALKNRLLPGKIYILALPHSEGSFLPVLNGCSKKLPYFASSGKGLTHYVTYGMRTRELEKLPDAQIVDRVIGGQALLAIALPGYHYGLGGALDGGRLS